MKSKAKDENVFPFSSINELSTQPKLCGIVNPIQGKKKEKNSIKKDHDQSLLQVKTPNKKREAKVSADNESKIASKKIKGLDWFLQEKKASATSANKSSVTVETLDNVSFITL